VISRLAAALAALLALLGVLYVWRLANNPDSGLHVGVIGALPIFALAIALGATAYWTRPGADDSD